MKKSLLIAGAAMLLLCIAVAVVWRSSPPEPVWHGRTLTEWTDDLAIGSSVQIREEAEKAVQGIGTNAIPHLLRMLRTRETVFSRAKLWLNRRQKFFQLRVSAALAQHVRAWMGFQALGEKAEPALPALRQMLLSNPRTDFLTESIAVISPRSVPILLDAVPRVPTIVRSWLIRGALRWPSQRHLVRPVVEQCLTHPDPTMRLDAVVVLRSFTENSSEVVADLIPLLKDPAPRVRTAALESLPSFGTNALPALREIRARSDLFPADVVTRVIAEIQASPSWPR